MHPDPTTASTRNCTLCSHQSGQLTSASEETGGLARTDALEALFCSNTGPLDVNKDSTWHCRKQATHWGANLNYAGLSVGLFNVPPKLTCLNYRDSLSPLP